MGNRKRYNASIVGTDGKELLKQRAVVVRESYFRDAEGDEVYMVFFETEHGEIFHAGYKLNPENPVVEDGHWHMICEAVETQHNIKIIFWHEWKRLMLQERGSWV